MIIRGTTFKTCVKKQPTFTQTKKNDIQNIGYVFLTRYIITKNSFILCVHYYVLCSVLGKLNLNG